jgi:hypothetical protein
MEARLLLIQMYRLVGALSRAAYGSGGHCCHLFMALSVAPASCRPAACAPEVLEQIRHSLKTTCPAELVGLLPGELKSLAELICALNEPDGQFRSQFASLRSREELVALAAMRGIPLQPSLLERFERLAPVGRPEVLSDGELQAVSAGGVANAVLLGLRAHWPALLSWPRS